MALILAPAALVARTDSGGLQEEATVVGVPCLTARLNTERPVTVTEGTNRLVASSRDAILPAAKQILAGGHRPNRRRSEMLCTLSSGWQSGTRRRR
ncbi:MAG: hypothetical protein EXR94_13295 [Gemmatimonadetes bacterium]|nr:hypothetical protein [Gemmatimonadota bacterium]